MPRTDDQVRAQMASLQLRNSAQIDVISKFAVDLSQPQQIDLSFWAPDESSAKIFAEACTRNEMPPQSVQPPVAVDSQQRLLIVCPIQASVNFVADIENIGTFIMLADKFNCEYDGWGTAIVEAAGPIKPS